MKSTKDKTSQDKKSSRSWLVLALIVAAITVAVFYYIGRFDAETHVDTPYGDNVTEQYELTEPDAQAPGEADWQNAGHQSLREVITDPAAEPQTPPTSID